MIDPWRMVLVRLPDGSTVPTRVWLPPISGVRGEHDGPDGRVELPDQPVPHQPAAVRAVDA